MNHNPGFGATDDLGLRLSVATLARVLFKDPSNAEIMLALERKATLNKAEFEVKSQPFGGAVRIRDLGKLQELIGNFHFDSEHSRSELDFRLFIRQSSWPAIREFCIQHICVFDDPILETNPARELAEEFADALMIDLKPNQYICIPVTTVVENDPAPTGNTYAKGILTVRVYRIFEVTILDTSLINIILKTNASISHDGLFELAMKDSHNGGKGRANVVLALPLKRITETYLAMPLKERNSPILFEQNRLDETVPAVLDGVDVPKYQRL
jgi:hypothetical protein